ncbi:CLUMA_CG008277, isoform A [Clunio marinus]|uniref:CLUMA_CG008277, isoform A n=1 Tax=Clunio marinus TaxID=568069 RepID=A0A1J1I376_9DIPT|nr:CLUMA_CG008277, isoform A [Clunio marinus]
MVINFIKNAPVGENYRDHATAAYLIKVNPNAPAQALSDINLQTHFYYTQREVGHMGMCNVQAFINTKDPKAIYPEIQYWSYRFTKNQVEFGKILSNYGFKDEFMSEIQSINQDFEILYIVSALLNTKSRGKIELRGADPTLKPKITSGFPTNSDGVATSIRERQQCKTLLLNLFVSTFQSTTFMNSCLMTTEILWHPSGIVKMGNASDAGAVVDEKLGARRLKNLRVADGSMMPTVPSSNTYCPIHAIEAKAAAMITKE